MANTQFTPEDLENIRLIAGNKVKQLKGNLKNLEGKDIPTEKKTKILDESNQDIANLSLIEAKCMRQLSDLYFKSLENENTESN